MSAEKPVPGIRICVYGLTDVGVVRKNNEDTFVIAELTTGTTELTADILRHTVGERGTLLLVSDGMGGAEAGEVASRMVARHVSLELAAAPLDQPPQDAIRTAVERANEAICSEATSNPARQGMGATLVAAWVRGANAYVASVGDSRLYLMRGGRVRQITRDQSMVETMVEAGAMSREQAEKHPQRNVILQAMGATPNVAVALERVELRRGDVLVLCSDGLSGKMIVEEMRDAILMTPDLEQACRRMVQLAKDRGGEDNITVVLGELDGEGLLAAPRGERLTRTLQPMTRFDFKTGSGYAAAPDSNPTIPLGSPKNEEEGAQREGEGKTEEA
jgi:serine/threonine protein phosphatase PrpC